MRPGYLTTEFWLVLAANVLTQAGAIDVPEHWKWLITLATITGYALSRGLAKVNEPTATSWSHMLDPELSRAAPDDPSPRQATP